LVIEKKMTFIRKRKGDDDEVKPSGDYNRTVFITSNTKSVPTTPIPRRRSLDSIRSGNGGVCDRDVGFALR
jgi:hypothetical protein